ncbi:heme peroxidase [Lindgomyces ingoldianus]|uniref:Heme peroxidase n=1 Tax=Lindgomyces ingoldianus TaxID=673940 RepID=A0ACB6QRL9_9PLEO|nr:heme peroxidase [Lindgomyces ingoldianus]KAF2468942.1 heme peroxidase [Lindgomyces ingoldianus]
MRVSNVLLLAATASAFSFPDVSPVTNLFRRKDGGGGGGGGGGSKCDPKWKDISTILTAKFLTNGICNPDARAAIRAVFHDCGAWESKLGATGGCDGSLALAPGEIDRGENQGLGPIVAYLKGLAQQKGVSVADMIVFAGSHAIVTCPGGPRVKTFIGRKDSNIPPPNGLLPDVNAPAADLFKLFQNKGYDEVGLAALLGAHSTSNQFNQNTTPGIQGQPQDSTPGVWDVRYYSETLNPPKNIFVFPSDSKLANFERVGKEFKGFINNQGKWSGKFADAMGKMELFGVASTSGMQDCTDSLPQTTNIKREMKAMNMFMPRN